ncbi:MULTISPECIES: transposase [Emticicia]|uniref:transposase n=1 Tax=Emticicia TaxID=312278 RepID=UPI0007D8BFF4|nr:MULTISPECIES: transposase [Emticicia]
MADKFQKKYRIPSARHPHWDYGTNGAYFITICTKNRQYFLGECEKGKMGLSTVGAIVQGFWYEIPKHFPFIELGEFIVMPNHIHGILILNKNGMDENIIKPNDKIDPIDPVETGQYVETGHCPVSTDENISTNKTIGQKRFRNQGKNTISSIIGSYKSICTKHIHKAFPLMNFEWQTRFWDNIIRDDEAFNTISQYIINNPLNWKEDRMFGEETDNLNPV